MCHQDFDEAPEGYQWIFRPFIRKKDGTIVRPVRAKYFRFLVPL